MIQICRFACDNPVFVGKKLQAKLKRIGITVGFSHSTSHVVFMHQVGIDENYRFNLETVIVGLYKLFF